MKVVNNNYCHTLISLIYLNSKNNGVKQPFKKTGRIEKPYE